MLHGYLFITRKSSFPSSINIFNDNIAYRFHTDYISDVQSCKFLYRNFGLLDADCWIEEDKSDVHRAVISSVWCTNNNEFCYWLTHLSKLDKVGLYKILKRHQVPDEEKWGLFNINIKRSYSNCFANSIFCFKFQSTIVLNLF